MPDNTDVRFLVDSVANNVDFTHNNHCIIATLQPNPAFPTNPQPTDVVATLQFTIIPLPNVPIESQCEGTFSVLSFRQGGNLLLHKGLPSTFPFPVTSRGVIVVKGFNDAPLVAHET